MLVVELLSTAVRGGDGVINFGLLQLVGLGQAEGQHHHCATEMPSKMSRMLQKVDRICFMSRRNNRRLQAVFIIGL